MEPDQHTSPDSPHDHALNDLGDRLAQAAKDLLAAANARTARQLADTTRIDPTTARRVIRMIADNAQGAIVLTRAPSHAHLQRLANQARTRGVDPTACDQLHNTAADFAALLKSRGLSRTELTRLIRDERDDNNNDPDDDTTND
ncbi:MAG: hypothetical protein ACTS3F_03845 [Phycisphaerales bacterium]